MSGPGPQDPRGGAPPQGEEDELLSLAYGELGGAEERALRARLASDPNLAAQLGDIERIRSMFGAMEDEEPPPGLSAQLLSQAAQAARPAAREAARWGEGFWARVRGWLAPITAHPGLAAAASMLLVAGVAGVLVARKGPDLAQSEYQAADPATTAPSPELDRTPGSGGAAAPAEQPAAPTAAAAPAFEAAAQNGALDQGQAGGLAGSTAGDAEDDKQVAARPARRGRAAAKPRASVDKRDPAPPADVVLGLRDGVEAKGATAAERAEPAKQKSGKDTLADEDALGDSPAQAPVASTPQAPPPSPPPADPSRAVESAPTQAAPASAAELHKRALAAASSRRCLEVQSIDRTIRTLDPKYSDSVFRADRRLATCLPAVKRAKRAK